MGIFRGQKSPDEAFPVFLRGGVDVKEKFRRRGRGAGGEFPAGVKIERIVDSPFFQAGHQVVERIEFPGIEGVGSSAGPGRQEVFEMVEPDRIVSGPGDFSGKRLRLLSGEIVGALAEVDAEKADPLLRSVPEDEVPRRIGDDPAVLPGRSVQRAGEIQR